MSDTALSAARVPPTSMDDVQTLESGRRVLNIEAAALTAFSGQLDASFAAAVDVLLSIKGRVIISGMGKSGHVARKIAATFASTGTPAQFIHPGEASHGDLGMVTKDDAALVLSNSGETAELADLIAYTRRYQIPLIGVAAQFDSTLMNAADIALLLPRAEEACPVGLAPTTSTTLTMALGDALAVALMERRGFTPENFHQFHPGGALGSKLIKVSEIMHTGAEMPVVQAETPMRETLIEMTSKGFGIAGVVDGEGRLAGVITDGDLRRKMEVLLESTAGDVATQDPLTIEPDILVSAALGVMNNPDRPTTCLFVVDPSDPRRAPIGVVHMHDVLRAGVR